MATENETINLVAQRAAVAAMKVIQKQWNIPVLAAEDLHDAVVDSISNAIESTLAALPEIGEEE